ncbi:MAG: hypothetical protein H6653_18680 [Ardenticatenaceae bacterium]|nr:hypothetical protein [Ardenticatenaceae bacterium]
MKWTEETYKQTWTALSLAALVWLAVACTTAAEPTPIRTDPGPAECEQRVLVIVWGDLNEDGVPDPDEPTLENVQVMVTTQGNPTENGIQLETNEEGRANFPTLELENCQTAGYQALFLRQVAGYEFPAQPVVDLDDFDPLRDTVYFGLLPINDNNDG